MNTSTDFPCRDTRMSRFRSVGVFRRLVAVVFLLFFFLGNGKDVCAQTPAPNCSKSVTVPITVNDNCAIDRIVWSAPGATPATGTINGPGTLIGAGPASTLTGNVIAVFPIGLTTVTAKSWDAKNNMGDQTSDAVPKLMSFVVEVRDGTSPVITPTAQLLTGLTTTTSCLATVSGLKPSIADCAIGMASSGVKWTMEIKDPAGVVIHTESGSLPTLPSDSFDKFPVGVSTVTYTATDFGPFTGKKDAAGNVTANATTTEKVSVTVTDPYPPVFATMPANIDKNLVAGTCTEVIPVSVNVTDNCAVTERTWTVNNGGLPASGGGVGAVFPTSFTFKAGTTTITYTAKDAAGNSTTSTAFTVTLKDATAPVLTVTPSPLNPYETDPNLCTKSLNVLSSAVDDCSGETVYWKMTAPDGVVTSGTGQIAQPFLFPVGTTSIVYYAEDGSANKNKSAEQTYTVLVEDKQKPVITPLVEMNAFTAGVDPYKCSALLSPADPGITENCPGPYKWKWTTVEPNGGLSRSGVGFVPANTEFQLGVTTITYTVKDAAGNDQVAPMSFKVTVKDNILPVIVQKGPIAVNTDSGINGFSETVGYCYATLSGLGVDVSDNCPFNSTISLPVAGLSDYFRKWTTDVAVTLADGTVTNSGVGNIPDKTLFFPGTTRVTYWAKDQSDWASPTGIGNESLPMSFDVTVKDIEKPVIAVPHQNKTYTQNADAGGCAAFVAGSELKADYEDNCVVKTLSWVLTGATTGSLDAPGVIDNLINGHSFNMGLTTVTYAAWDKSDNEAVPVTFDVEIRDNVSPVVTGLSNRQGLFVGNNCDLQVSGLRPNVADCMLSMSNSGVHWTRVITDHNDNVIDNIKGDLPADQLPDSYTFPKGKFTVKYTMQDFGDFAGKRNSVTGEVEDNDPTETEIIVEIKDNTKPVITQVLDKGLNNDPTLCGAAFSNLGVQVKDDCPVTWTWTADKEVWVADATVPNGLRSIAAGTSTSGDVPDNTFFSVGTTVVTYTATDEPNYDDTFNTSDAMRFKVEVKDVEFPTVEIPLSSTTTYREQPVGNDQCYATIDLDPVTTDDNCDVKSVTWKMTRAGAPDINSASTGINEDIPSTKFEIGVTTVTYTVTDIYGNVTVSDPFTITVTNEKPVAFAPKVVEVKFKTMITSGMGYTLNATKAAVESENNKGGKSTGWVTDSETTNSALFTFYKVPKPNTSEREYEPEIGDFKFIPEGNGKYTYTPKADFTGHTSFWYTVKDACGNESDPVEIKFWIPNTPPVIDANKPKHKLEMKQLEKTMEFDLTKNFSDPENNIDLESIVVIEGTFHGNLTRIGDFKKEVKYSYTPNLKFYGKDYFELQVKDFGEKDMTTIRPEISATKGLKGKGGNILATVDDCGNLLNSGVPLCSTPARYNITVFPDKADLAIEIKSDPDIHNVEEKLFTYTLKVNHKGVDPAINVVVEDPLPENMDFISATATKGTYTYNPVTHTLTWIWDEMFAGQEETITMVVRAKGVGVVTNAATVKNDTYDPVLSNNYDMEIRLLFFAPNVFSPNGDGINDYFVIEGIQEYENEFTVFNRWGSEVFIKRNYSNDWDGSQLPNATYYYILKLKNNQGKWESYTGHVTIVR